MKKRPSHNQIVSCNISVLYTLVFILFGFYLSRGQDISKNCDLSYELIVLDYHDNQEPLANAEIIIEELQITAKTNAAGKVLLDNLCETSFTLFIDHPECNPQTFEVKLNRSKSDVFFLEHHFEQLDEVELIGSNITRARKQLVKQLDEQWISSNRSKSLGDALKNLNGVSTLQTGTTISKPVIQGLRGSRIVTISNGIRQEDMEWGDEHAPSIQMGSFDQIKIEKGANALAYGTDALGGVIVLEHQKFFPINSEKNELGMGYHSNGKGGYLFHQIKKTYESGTYFKSSLSYQRFGDRTAPDYNLSNTGNKNESVNLIFGRNKLKYGWELNFSLLNNEIGILRASHLGNLDDLVLSINSQTPLYQEDFRYEILNPKQEVFHGVFSASYFKQFNSKSKIDFLYSYQYNRRKEYDIRRGVRYKIPSMDMNLNTHDFRANFRQALKNGLFRTGFNIHYQENEPNPETGVRRFIPDYQKLQLGYYAILNQNLSEYFNLSTGFRFDYMRYDVQKFYLKSRFEQLGYDQKYPEIVAEDLGTQVLTVSDWDFQNKALNIGLIYEPSNVLAADFQFNALERAPNAAELFSDGLHHSAARIELGQLDLNSEKALKFDVGLSYNNPNFSIRLNSYFNSIKDFIYLYPSDIEYTLRGAFPVWSYGQADSRFVGFSTEFLKPLGTHWSLNSKWSTVKATNLDLDQPQINIPSAEINNLLRFETGEKNRLQFSVEQQIVFEQKNTPDNLFVELRANEVVELRLNDAPPTYLNYNAFADYSMYLKKNRSLNFKVSLLNIFNETYRNYLNQQRYFVDEPGRNLQFSLIYKY